MESAWRKSDQRTAEAEKALETLKAERERENKVMEVTSPPPTLSFRIPHPFGFKCGFLVIVTTGAGEPTQGVGGTEGDTVGKTGPG